LKIFILSKNNKMRLISSWNTYVENAYDTDNPTGEKVSKESLYVCRTDKDSKDYHISYNVLKKGGKICSSSVFLPFDYVLCYSERVATDKLENETVSVEYSGDYSMKDIDVDVLFFEFATKSDANKYVERLESENILYFRDYTTSDNGLSKIEIVGVVLDENYRFIYLQKS